MRRTTENAKIWLCRAVLNIKRLTVVIKGLRSVGTERALLRSRVWETRHLIRQLWHACRTNTQEQTHVLRLNSFLEELS